MGMQRRFREPQRKQDRVAIGVIAIVLIGVLAFIFAGYWFHWSWTGFLNKTLWDWLQLLIIPVVLAIGGFWLNQIQKNREERTTAQRAENERKAAEQHAELERELARDNQREAALQDYIDKMSELLLHEQLADELPSDPQESIARARTVTVLRILDPNRRGSLIRFLSQAGILTKCIEDKLAGIDLRGADLDHVNFSKINLRETDLGGANLSSADLTGANLSKANLSKANLLFAYLDGARPLRGQTLPDQAVASPSQRGQTYRGRSQRGSAHLCQPQWSRSLPG
jgi:DNA segregation ATPase FtsK/SpoIIIE-like protein